MNEHAAPVEAPVLNAIVQRWSPYGLDERPVPDELLRSLFEAARWAASSFNAQPWRYLLARRDDRVAFERMLGCLVEANQAWARAAPVLALGVVQRHFEHNGKPNRCAEHDLGAASTQLALEAAARGLQVHQMAGVEPVLARERYGIPEGFDVITALAIGYPAADGSVAETLAKRDAKPRERRPLRDTVFASWGEPGLELPQ